MRPIGQTTWVIAGGHIPLRSTGPEPDSTSFDAMCMLNTGDHPARVEVTIYYSNREPAGPHQLAIEARRTRHVRFNDLIDPEAIPLDTDFAAVVESDRPIVVQFMRQDTSRTELALLGGLAYGCL